MIKPHIPSTNIQSINLSSVVSIPNVDMYDMERRRNIALKALSERLARTTDASRQHLLPKSLPHHQHHQHGGGGHSHHHHGHGDSSQPSFIAQKQQPIEFTVPAIPLPPPPSMQSHTDAGHATLIDLHNPNNI